MERLKKDQALDKWVYLITHGTISKYWYTVFSGMKDIA